MQLKVVEDANLTSLVARMWEQVPRATAPRCDFTRSGTDGQTCETGPKAAVVADCLDQRTNCAILTDERRRDGLLGGDLGCATATPLYANGGSFDIKCHQIRNKNRRENTKQANYHSPKEG